MSKRDTSIYLKDILEEIRKVKEFFSTIKNKEDLDENELIFYATLKALENIGEAVKHIPEDIKDSHKEIPWNQIVGLRNILIHEYFGISTAIIYDIVVNELPLLQQVIENILVDFTGSKS